MDRVPKTWTVVIGFIEGAIISITIVDAIDIVARVIAATAAVVIAYFSVKRLKRETELAEAKLLKERFEQRVREAEAKRLEEEQKKKK